ncbi:MAG: helix-turn-helix domain-containing protein [Acidimicrobiia bacterium]
MSETPAGDTHTWAMALGHTIKVRRTELGMSRKQLAEASEISYSYLSAIENGTKVPSTNTLRVIARRLGVESYVIQAEAEGRIARGLDRVAADDSIDALVAQQERRFLERQQARVAAGGFGADSAADRRKLASLITSLDDDDIATLARVAEGLVLRRRDPLTP